MSCGTRAHDSARAILMVLGSSVLPSDQSLTKRELRTAFCWCCVLLVASHSATSAVSPVAHPAYALAENPTAELPGARARSRRLHRGTTHQLHCWVPRTALPTGTATAVLPMATSHHCGSPDPVASPVAVLQQPWHRNSATAPSCELQLRVLLPGSSSLPGPAVLLGYERNHNHTTTQYLLQPP
jgi:hypothetical protein